MTGHVNIGGTWKAVDEIHVNVGGTWKQVSEGHVNVGGTWKQFYVSEVVTLSGEDVSHVVADPSNALAGLRFDTDGNVYKIEGSGNETQIDTTTDWIRPTTGADQYQIRYTNLVGDALTGVSPAEDTWTAVSSGDVILQMAQAVVGSRSATFDVQVRKGTGSVLATTEYSLTATVT